MIALNGTKITPTIFPDQTSQVWKLPVELLNYIYKEGVATIQWEFEYEGELMHLAQLKMLLDSYGITVSLFCPYLPYARQDKHISNETTFALRAFAQQLNAMNFSGVQVIDAHSHWWATSLIKNLEDDSPIELIRKAKKEVRASTIVFPDSGAELRYHQYELAPYLVARKVRDQSTGEITDVVLTGDCSNEVILIVDDLADGGRSFIEVAKLAYANGAKECHLYTTHGLYSKGVQVLRDARIKRIFNRKGEVL